MGKRHKTFEVYLVYIDADKCDGCEECVNMCPVNVFDMSHKAYPTRPQNCLGYGTCVALCKSNAIIITEIWNNLAWRDFIKCGYTATVFEKLAISESLKCHNLLETCCYWVACRFHVYGFPSYL